MPDPAAKPKGGSHEPPFSCSGVPSDYWMTCTTVRVCGSTSTVLSFTIV